MADTDGFQEMVQISRTFFADLAANNSREWFDAHRATYDTEIKAPADLFTSLMAEDLSRLTGTPMQGKLFRIHRDVRFSKDKRPYNPHLHILWRAAGAEESRPAFFFACEPGLLMLACGVMGLQKESLTRYRALVDARGDEIVAEIEHLGAHVADWRPAPLKRVPAPYPADHPHGDLLRRKTLILHLDLEPTGSALFRDVRQTAERYLPFYRLLDAGLRG